MIVEAPDTVGSGWFESVCEDKFADQLKVSVDTLDSDR